MSRTTALPGAPGSFDHNTRWALRAAHRRRGRTADRRPGLLFTTPGSAVVLATARMPYGHSTHSSAHLTHLVDEILIAFHNGQAQTAQASRKCQAATVHFQLTAQLTGRLCPACLTAALREATTMTGLTGRDIHRLREVRAAACQQPGCPPEAAAVELAAAARAAAPNLADTDIAARLLQLTAQTAKDDTAGAWLIALTAAAVAGPVLDQEPTHV